jgi:hypothetical protein
MLEQSIHLLHILLLLLLDVSHCLSHVFLPLCVIMQSTLYGGSCFFNGFEAYYRCVDWSSCCTYGLRRTFVLLERSDVHLKLLLVYAQKISHHCGSVQNSLYAICPLYLAAMNPLNDQVWVGS